MAEDDKEQKDIRNLPRFVVGVALLVLIVAVAIIAAHWGQTPCALT